MNENSVVSVNSQDRLVAESVGHSIPGDVSDQWLQEISLRRASFEYAHRLKYALDIKPCVIGGKQSIVVARDLEARDQFAYDHIVRFAEEYNLNLVIDRRTEHRSVDNDRRAA